jgi:hypothetical protein
MVIEFSSLWTAAFLALFVLSFHDFLVLFSSSSWVFLSYTSCVPKLHLLLFNDISITY